MRAKNILVDLDLHLFDGEGAATPAGDGGETGTQTGDTNRVAAGRTGRRENPLANVQYGRQEEPMQDDTAGQGDVPDKATAFQNLIKGEYKQEYQDSFQKVFNERFKAQKEESEQKDRAIQEMLEVTDLIAERYGADPNDMAAIRSALENDSDMWETAAMKDGLSLEQYKEKKRLERENAALRRSQEIRMQQKAADDQYQKWTEEAAEVQAFYPDFDLETEASDPQFISLLKTGIGMKAAYQALHFDDLVTEGMAQTAQAVKSNLANAAQSRRNRPAENGSSGRAAAITKTDVSKLSRADRAEIARRASRGDRVVF